MSSLVNHHSVVAPDLANLYAPIALQLVQVEDRLRRELQSDYPAVDELVRYGFRIGGKRLRPALLLLAGRACGELVEAHIVLSAVVEMIHTATLVHDDVLDEASLRRHMDTVNARWDNERSVLLGDFLFTHAFYLASTLDSTFACRTIGRSTNIVCEGELRQTDASGDLQLSEEDYFDIIQAKTAELCACCCRLGAHYSGADLETEDALWAFGANLGIAFQIADDMLDLLGDENATGKSLGTDLKKQKATLPLIHLLGEVPPEERDELCLLLAKPSPERRSELLGWLQRYDSIDYARAQAERYARQAAENLSLLPPSPAVTILEQMTEFVVARHR